MFVDELLDSRKVRDQDAGHLVDGHGSHFSSDQHTRAISGRGCKELGELLTGGDKHAVLITTPGEDMWIRTVSSPVSCVWRAS